MKPKEFIKKIIINARVISTSPIATSCLKDDDNPSNPSNCDVTPTEIVGTFTTMTPAQQVQANIIEIEMVCY